MHFFFFSSFGFVLPPIATELLLSSFSKFVFSSEANKDFELTIALLIISVILTIIYLYIFLGIALQVLTFQPMSLITVCTIPQNLIIFEGILINILAGFCEFAGKGPTTYFCFIVALFYLGATFIPFYKGGLARLNDARIYMGSCITGFATSILIAIFFDFR